MVKIKTRLCPECAGEMRPRLINMLYKKEGCDAQIDVIDIPANVCGQCHYRIIPAKVAQYIDSLVDPVFAAELRRQERVLPAPHVDIMFPALEKPAYAF